MKHIFIAVWVLMSVTALAQDETKNKIQPFKKEIEVDFLSSYYNQDGDNAAVTGGKGTEKLIDIANTVIVNIPIDSVNAVNLYGGVDVYTSASTDNINQNKSSASHQDARSFATISYSRLNLKKGDTYGVKVGFSTEYDVTSISGGLDYTKSWNDNNTELSLAAQAYFDTWQLIFPSELRGRASLSDNQRQSYNASLIFSQILSKRTQISLSAEAIYMKGLLSTPFHRVYFAQGESKNVDIERLPDARLKIPVAIRFNYFPTDGLVFRSYYRYYWDDFGIKAHTAELEVPIKATPTLTIAPFYRYHTQTAADYFAPYQAHRTADGFYTSDYDLSAFHSHKFGMNIKYYPLYGIIRSKPMFKSKNVLMWKYAAIRGGYYTRDTGLNAYIISFNLGFGFK